MSIGYTAAQDLLRGLIAAYGEVVEDCSQPGDRREAALERQRALAADLQRLRTLADHEVAAIAERHRRTAGDVLQ